MTRPTFPLIPEIEDGQVFSAAIMRHTHKAAIEYLLGESHAAMALPHVRVPSTDVFSTDYQTVWELWGYLQSYLLYYKLAIRINYGDALNRNWHYRIQVSSDGGTTWYTAKEETGTQNTYQDKEGTVDLTTVSDGGAGSIDDHLTLTAFYLWRLQLKVSNQGSPADSTVYCIPWGIGTRGAVSGWVTPTTFAAATSAAADINTLRTDANALHAALPTANVGTTQPAYALIYGDWVELSRVSYRYLGDQLRVQVAASGWQDGTWKWRARLIDEADNTATIHESGEVGGDAIYGDPEYWIWRGTTITLTAGAVAAAIAAAGITLTRGDWYRVIVELYTTADPGRVWGLGARVDRLSSGTVGVDYTVPGTWTHGDTNVGPTKLNVYSADLTALYSGTESLSLDVPAVDIVADSAGTSLVHRKRYLFYYNAVGATIHYGADYATTYGLTDSAAAWAWVDLEAVGVPYGGAYWVSGVDIATETEATS